MTSVDGGTDRNQAPLDPRVERTRAAVLEAASALLVEGGAAAVTIDAIVERSRVARTSIYRHWPNRSAVLAATFAHLIPEISQSDPDLPAEGGLRQVMQRFSAELESAPWVAVLPAFLESARHDDELRGLFVQFVEARKAPFATAVIRAVDAGLLPRDTGVDEAVLQLAGPLVFSRMVRGESDGRFADRLVDLLLASRRS